MITAEFAARFAADWIDSWNAHDLERVLSHYTGDFEMSSPIIERLMNEPSGMLRGREVIRAYWAKALAQNPGLHFELLHVFVGAGSVNVVYRGHRGLAAEVFWFRDDGKVYRAAAHYLTEAQ